MSDPNISKNPTTDGLIRGRILEEPSCAEQLAAMTDLAKRLREMLEFVWENRHDNYDLIRAADATTELLDETEHLATQSHGDSTDAETP
jgi:hypothetical protein